MSTNISKVVKVVKVSSVKSLKNEVRKEQISMAGKEQVVVTNDQMRKRYFSSSLYIEIHMIDTLIAILHQKWLIHYEEYFKINESTNHDVYDVWDVVLKIDINKQQLYKEYLVLQQISDKTKCAHPLFWANR